MSILRTPQIHDDQGSVQMRPNHTGWLRLLSAHPEERRLWVHRTRIATMFRVAYSSSTNVHDPFGPCTRWTVSGPAPNTQSVRDAVSGRLRTTDGLPRCPCWRVSPAIMRPGL